MMNSGLAPLWEFIIFIPLLIGLCISTYFLFKVIGRVNNTKALSRSFRKILITVEQQKIISDVLQLFLTATFFIVLFMRFFDPDIFEHYYVIPNVYCTGWILGCLQSIEQVYSFEWKPVGRLSKGGRIQNYLLWFLIYGILVFMMRKYVWEPLPYYVMLPLLALLTTTVVMLYRNVRSVTREERTRLEEHTRKTADEF